MTRILFLVFALFMFGRAFTQAPTISNFAPAFAQPGNSIIINGGNFSTTAANNLVYAGAVRAVVTAATSNKLTVTVPFGATNQKISVTVGGLTAHSSLPFTPTFSGGGTVNASSFGAPIILNSGIGHWGIESADLNVDGRPDLMVSYTNLTATNGWSAALFENTGAPALITFRKNDFAGELLTPGKLSDFDGDGLVDMVLVSPSRSILTAFKNPFSPNGVISSPTSYFTIVGGRGMQDVACADIDGDGKIDLVVCNRTDKTVSVLRNTSTGGNISFAQPIAFTAPDPYRVAVADVNQDGKHDVIVANFSGSVSIFGNAATPGVVNSTSLAPKVDLGITGFPSSIAITDLDADSKADIIATNGNTICILKNINTGGPITASSFAGKVDIPMGFFVDVVQAADIDGDGKPDLVVSNGGRNSISVLKNITAAGNISSTSFNSRVDYALADQVRSICILDADRDSRPDIFVGTGTTLTYLQNVIGLPPPMIASFSPSSGGAGNTITISGSNFSTTLAANTVKFNGVLASVSSATATSISATVPESATSGNISVTVAGRTATSISTFVVLPVPKITSFSPTSGVPGTAVTISGSNFDAIPTNNIVKFNGVTASVSTSSPASLVATVPQTATTGFISVTVNGQTGQSGKGYIVPPIVSSTLPRSYDDGAKLSASIVLNDASKVSEVVFAGRNDLGINRITRWRNNAEIIVDAQRICCHGWRNLSLITITRRGEDLFASRSRLTFYIRQCSTSRVSGFPYH